MNRLPRNNNENLGDFFGSALGLILASVISGRSETFTPAPSTLESACDTYFTARAALDDLKAKSDPAPTAEELRAQKDQLAGYRQAIKKYIVNHPKGVAYRGHRFSVDKLGDVHVCKA